jgi:formylglycine-generating enzyme required for sulfatase activity
MNRNRGICVSLSAAATCGLLLLAIAGCTAKPPPAPPARKAASTRPSNPPPKSEPSELPTVVEPFTLPDKQFAVELAPGLSLEFVGIPPGSFMMGNNSLGVRRHRETIAKPFYLGKYEVTQEQWQAVMGNNPSLHKDSPQRPVERVDWDQCQAFLKKLNEKFSGTGMVFGLPTEAQWEFACRAGATLRIDSTDNPDTIADYAWFASNSELETHSVGEKRPNPWELYDMQGNVAEWCANNATNMADDQTPGGAVTPGNEFHVVRGGNWKDSARECTSMSRVVRRGQVSLRFDGLRVMCTPK